MKIIDRKYNQIGFLIKAHRRKQYTITKAFKYTQNGFNNLCSPNTLVRLEKGIAPRDKGIEHQLIEKLNFKFGDFRDIDDEVEMLIDKLYAAIELYELKKIDKLTLAIMDTLKDSQEYIWYYDLYVTTGYIREYFMNSEMLDADTISYIVDALPAFSEKFQELLKLIVFAITYLTYKSSDFMKICKEIDIENVTSMANKINVLLYYMSTDQTTKLILMIEELAVACKEQHNTIRLFDTYNIAVVVMGYYDKKRIASYKKRIDEEINLKDIPISKLSDYYYNIGTTFYSNEKYEEAIEYLQKCIRVEPTFPRPSFVVIAAAQRALGQEIAIPRISDETIQTFPNDLKLMYEYYAMSDEIPGFVKQKFIMQELLPNFRPGDEMNINLFKKELEFIVQDTNRYKDVVVYEIKARQLLAMKAE